MRNVTNLTSAWLTCFRCCCCCCVSLLLLWLLMLFGLYASFAASGCPERCCCWLLWVAMISFIGGSIGQKSSSPKTSAFCSSSNDRPTNQPTSWWVGLGGGWVGWVSRPVGPVRRSIGSSVGVVDCDCGDNHRLGSSSVAAAAPGPNSLHSHQAVSRVPTTTQSEPFTYCMCGQSASRLVSVCGFFSLLVSWVAVAERVARGEGHLPERASQVVFVDRVVRYWSIASPTLPGCLGGWWRRALDKL